MPEGPVFKDRREAGQRLAEMLQEYRDDDPIVLGLPRGGVVVGYEIASRLDAPLDIIVARKLGAPSQPELGVGAVAPEGVTLLDRRALDMLGIAEEEIEEVAARERAEMRRRLQHYRGDGTLDVKDRTAILVDDGLATGVTALAAIHAIRRLEPRQIILAVGVCPEETAHLLQAEVDDLVCVACPEPFHAVGLWFQEFEQNTDEEVIELLEKARASQRV
jgi:putative phosphoribosyl transferase